MRAVLIAAAIAFVVTLAATPAAIRVLSARGYGQLIRDDGPTTHHTKRGTPTMGGVVIVAATLLAYFAAHLFTGWAPSVSGMLVLFLMTGLGVVGFIDDYIKVSKQRSLGLRARAKLAGELVVAVIFGVLALRFPDEEGVTPASTAISFIRDTDLSFGARTSALAVVLFVLWATLMVWATANGVNLTDGLDGLATGASVGVFAAYVFIGVWQFGNDCSVETAVTRCYEVRDPLDLALVAAALTGACFGFLWWNAAPAKIFMGDTGSLALGGAIAGLAITTRTELLLILLGGLFVIITLSVIVQVASFRLTGRRVLLMAPLQHHFELKGWGEVTIVIRFWIIAFLCVGAGLAAFYAEWVTTIEQVSS